MTITAHVDEVVIPCVAGRFFERRASIRASSWEVNSVVIPCVAGRFFERPQGYVSPATICAVVIPYVAGRFFEHQTTTTRRASGDGSRHPLRRGAVL